MITQCSVDKNVKLLVVSTVAYTNIWRRKQLLLKLSIKQAVNLRCQWVAVSCSDTRGIQSWRREINHYVRILDVLRLETINLSHRIHANHTALRRDTWLIDRLNSLALGTLGDQNKIILLLHLNVPNFWVFFSQMRLAINKSASIRLNTKKKQNFAHKQRKSKISHRYHSARTFADTPVWK